MARARSKTGRSSGWVHAILFNALLLLLPVMGANVTVSAFAARAFPAEPSASALTLTRARINEAFTAILPRSANRRAFWADLVDRELRGRDMGAATGFLLAAPYLLGEEDVKALRAAVDSVPSGSEDERLIQAALLFLPNDVRARYERATQGPMLVGLPEPAPEADPPVEDGEGDMPATGPAAADQPAPTRIVSARGPGFDVLGDWSEIARDSEDWIAGTQGESFALRLSGFAQITPGLGSLGPREVQEMASILKTAHRAGRLQPEYRAFLAGQLDRILPETTIRSRLADALEGVAPTSERGARVEAAFRESVNDSAVTPIAEEMRQIREISMATSATGAITLIEQVRDGSDMRRARYVAEAGGFRSVALAKQIGGEVLEHAHTGIHLSRETILQVMAAVAAAMALFWLTMAAIQRAFFAATAPA